MQTKFEIFENQFDKVISVSNDKIAIERASGDVEIFSFYTDENGVTRLSDDTILITGER